MEQSGSSEKSHYFIVKPGKDSTYIISKLYNDISSHTMITIVGAASFLCFTWFTYNCSFWVCTPNRWLCDHVLKRLLVERHWEKVGQYTLSLTSVYELAVHPVCTCETCFKPLVFYFVFFLIYNKVMATANSQTLSHWMFFGHKLRAWHCITRILQEVQTQRK